MKVSELIETLKKFPEDTVVVLCDMNRMAYEASGDPSGEGLYYDFEIGLDEEMFFHYKDEEQENPIPTIVISFETDYEEKEKEFCELEKYAKELEDNKK